MWAPFLIKDDEKYLKNGPKLRAKCHVYIVRCTMLTDIGKPQV